MTQGQPGFMDRFRAAIKDAFAVGPEGPAKPDAQEAELVERVAQEVVRRRMAQPALLFLESSRPLAGVGAATMHFLQPFATVVIRKETWSKLSGFLERPGSIEYLCQRIEAIDRQGSAPGA